MIEVLLERWPGEECWHVEEAWQEEDTGANELLDVAEAATATATVDETGLATFRQALHEATSPGPG